MTITRPSIWADSRLSLSLVSVSRPYLSSDDFSRPSSRPFLVRLTLDRSCSAPFRPSLGYRRSVGCHSLGRPSSDARLSLSRVSVIIPPSRDRVSAIIWLTCVTSGRFCVIFVWLLTDHLSDQPRLVGCLSRALSVAFDASLATDCLCLSIRLSPTHCKMRLSQKHSLLIKTISNNVG